MPTLVITEVAYLLGTRMGVDPEVRFLGDLAAGNLIGSNIFNLLLILGATSLTRPLTVESITTVDLTVMILVTVLALVLMLTRAWLRRREGIVLVSVYAAYMVWLYVQ